MIHPFLLYKHNAYKESQQDLVNGSRYDQEVTDSIDDVPNGKESPSIPPAQLDLQLLLVKSAHSL